MRLLLVALLTVVAGPALGAPASFRPGERLSYDVTLLGVRTAEAQLWVEDGGEDQLQFQARGRTVGPADSLFNLRQTASCVVASDNLQPSICRFQSDRRGGERRREMRFDPENHTVRERTLDGGKHEDSTIAFDGTMTDVQEALSGLYYLRGELPEPGTMVRMRSVSKGKAVSVEVRGIRRENITTPAGPFRTVAVELHILGAGKDQTSSGVIWFSDDARHLPVKMSLDAPVGSLVAQLTSASGTIDPGLAGR
jgi:hypothetical protein